MRLENKVALVTGLGSGLGAAVAERFAQEGAHVVGCCRTPAAGEATIARVEAAGSQGLFVQADVSQTADVRRLVDATVSAFGRIDLLVNNAAVGMSSPYSTANILEIPDEDWDEVIRINLGSVFRMCKYTIPVMLAHGGGTIVNVSSSSSLVGFPSNHNYSAAKAGMNSLTQSIAVRFGPEGIRINGIAMGGMDTPMVAPIKNVSDAVMADEAQRFQVCPLGRISSVEEMAGVVVFAASEESAFMHGTTMVVDGGQVIAPVAHIPGIEHPDDSREL